MNALKFTFLNIIKKSLLPALLLIGLLSTSNAIAQDQTGKPEADTAENTASVEHDTKELEEVSIVSGYNKFNKKETDDVARLPLKNIENPQVYSVVTKELMQEQVITDYNSIFKNVPGAGVPEVRNQGRSSMLSRGFSTPNFIRNSISGFVYTSIDPANLEVLEAIKGPSGTLFNSSQISFGGLFNRVTKKPTNNAHRTVSYTGGSYNLNRLTFDVDQPLNEGKTVLMRFNGALHTEQSFQDQGFTRSVMLAPSFIIKANDRLTFLLDAEAAMFNATSPIRYTPSTMQKIRNIKDLGMDYYRSFNNNSLDYVTQQLNVYGQIVYKLSDSWKLQTYITRTYSTTKGYVTQLAGKTDSTLQQTVQKENFPYNGTEIQQNISGDFKIAGVRNRLVAGVDFYNQRSDRNTPTIKMPAINFLHPDGNYLKFNADYVDSAAANAVYQSYTTNQYTYSAYVSDVIDITDKLKAMLSLRFDHYVDKGNRALGYDTTAGAYTQNALSPKLGLVYEVIKDQFSLFGNYMNGFSNQGGSDVNGISFKPQTAYQWEVGFKVDAFNHKLSNTTSYYNINVTNSLRNDLENPGFSIQDGTQVSRGFETEFIANPFDGFNIIAAYTYNDSKYTQADKSVDGLRPASAGPQHLANLWMSYKVSSGKAKGLGAGVGGNYGSSAYQTNTKDFQFVIPAYKVFDVTIFYERPKYRLGVKVDNIADEHYWSYRLAPQMPRRFSANITFRF